MWISCLLLPHLFGLFLLGSKRLCCNCESMNIPIFTYKFMKISLKENFFAGFNPFYLFVLKDLPLISIYGIWSLSDILCSVVCTLYIKIAHLRFKKFQKFLGMDEVQGCRTKNTYQFVESGFVGKVVLFG